jgi:hypothetical protein
VPSLFDRDDPRHRFVAALALSGLLHGLILAGSAWHSSTAQPIRPGSQQLTATLVAANPVPAPPVPDSPPIAPTVADSEPLPVPEAPGPAIPIDSEPFLPSSHLTQQPVALSNPSGDALLRVMDLSPRGMVILSLWIDRHGQISRIEIERTNLTEEAAAIILATFGDLRFAPGERNGLPVNAHIQMEVKIH